MASKFQFYEIVRVIADSPRIRQSLIHKEGIIVGMSDPDSENKRDYAVYINDFMECFAFPEDLLDSCGRIGTPQDVIARPLRRKGN